MRLIRTDAEFALGRQLAVCLCALFLLVGVENGQAAAVAKTAPAPVNSAVVSAAPAPGLPALGVRLLGVMESQMTRKAMIALDGVEKPVLVAQGDLVSGYTVENIEEESVSLKQGADTRHLFVFANVKFVKSNQLAKTVKDVPSETELAEAKAAQRLKSRVASRQLATSDPGDEEPVRVSSRSVTRSFSSSIKFMHPMRNAGYVSSPFGYRQRPRGRSGYGSRYHQGIDLAVSEGTRVYSAASGVVKKTGYSWSQGNYVIVSHAGGYETHYYHLSRRPTVRSGQSVSTSQVIGYSGDTGISTGPHLHFQIEKNRRAVNPADYVAFGSRRSRR